MAAGAEPPSQRQVSDGETMTELNRLFRNGIWWAALVASFGASGCAQKGIGADRVAVELAQAAEIFRAAAPARRCEVGERVAGLLPHCPVRRQAGLGTGHFTVLDYAHPSYVLTEGQVVRLLGKPDAEIDGNYIYVICRESKYSGYLEVEIHEGRVATALLTGGF